MTIGEQAKDIKEGLQTWAQSEGGAAVLATNIHNMWEQARSTSKGPRAIIAYVGETIRGDFPIAAVLGRVDRLWNVAIMRGQGFAADRGSQLTDTVVNARPFYDLLEEARDIIRVLMLDPLWTERPIDYKGIRSMQMVNGEVLDGYIVEFSIGTQLQTITDQPPTNIATLP